MTVVFRGVVVISLNSFAKLSSLLNYMAGNACNNNSSSTCSSSLTCLLGDTERVPFTGP